MPRRLRLHLGMHASTILPLAILLHVPSLCNAQSTFTAAFTSSITGSAVVTQATGSVLDYTLSLSGLDAGQGPFPYQGSHSTACTTILLTQRKLTCLLVIGATCGAAGSVVADLGARHGNLAASTAVIVSDTLSDVQLSSLAGESLHILDKNYNLLACAK